MTAVGILGLGTFLPETIRTNDWWRPEDIASWRDRATHHVTRGDGAVPADLPDGARRTIAAMNQYAGDPFRGSVERRVMDPTMAVADMEVAAARQAIARAGIDADAIDVVLAQTPVPDHLMVNGACAPHHALGLRRDCLSMGTEGACNAFAMHLTLARALVASGAARHVLSLHSSAITRVHAAAQSNSPWWGDGAAAAVIGPVADGRGVLAARHYTDGRYPRALVLGVAEGGWWDGAAPITTQHLDREHTRQMLLHLVDRSREAIHGALADAGLGPADVGFYASHQGTAWLTQVTAAHAGLAHADTIVTFPRTANLNSANIPLILAEASRAGRLRDDGIVVTFGGGLGETWSATVLRWGR